jgi:PEP-CTERM/exosortase A-associated glycosyltransferase
MRILHVLHTSLPFICGYSIRSDYIVRYQCKQGLEPAVVTSAQQPDSNVLHEKINGISHWRTPACSQGLPPLVREYTLIRALQKTLISIIAEWRPDVIHAHSPMLVGLPALSEATKRMIPLIYEVRDLWENASVDRGKFRENSTAYKVARQLETRVLQRADAVVTICDQLREELAPRVGNPDRLFVVGNGVDTDRFAPTPASETFREQWGLKDRRIIGYVGTFQPYEGLDLLIGAMPRILKLVPQAHLLIVGSGGVEEQLRAQVAANHVDAAVTFTGRLPHSQVNDAYAVADFMVYPRILTRTTALTTPLKPLEAMAMGKAVIVSDVPAMHELIQNGRTGRMFRAGDVCDLAQQCIQILQEDRCRQQLGDAARAWVLSQRQWSTLISHYQDVYAFACGKGPV